MNNSVLDEARRAVEPLPTNEGGIIIVLATAGPPPALAMLSSGDLYVDKETVRAGLYGTTSAARRLGGAFSLLVPTTARAVRIETTNATTWERSHLVVLEGEISAARSTSEPPWGIAMNFFPRHSEGVAEHLQYWAELRVWLKAGAIDDPPRMPQT